MNLIDKLCDTLAGRDADRKGMLPDSFIHETFKTLKMPLNKK